ncbi:MAG: peptidoglycan DD-metalloendopeptidase family protein [Muribaculaceae bacterium]|nr:peptidoglycan DD-metalloendopeptidase family protein [Muribaculaceae bacterium]
MQFKQITLTLILTLASGSSALVAQNSYRVPDEHNRAHQEMLASQDRIGSQIRVEDTQAFIDNLFADEEEPELDIYTEGWDSRLVNAYANAVVPQTRDIDVSGYVMPHSGYITSPYGYRKRFRRMHKGVDIKVYIGDTIRAAFDGKVRLTNYQARGYGKYVILRHTNELETVYGHLSEFLVEDNQYVKAGDPIALGGNTGRSTGPHLHFETRFMGYPINPAAIFDFANQTVHTDVYTFDKDTYQQARNYDPAANNQYATAWRQANPQPARVASTRKSGSSGGSGNGAATYTVRKGDSLSKIAQRNGLSLQRLCRLNGLRTTSKIKVGQRLKLR